MFSRMAGHDVLAITLRAIWYYLAQHPQMKIKLRAEILAANSKHSSSSPIPYEKVSELPYLNAVISETLRYHPNTSTIIERVVPQGGATIDGYALPERTVVGVNAWILHFNTQIFGNDAHVFRPERWLEASEEKRAEMTRHIFTVGTPFTLGLYTFLHL